MNHSLLITKLENLCFDESLLTWMHSFLTGTKQIVRIDHFFSKEIDVIAGVPQRSYLGSLLFNLFINNITTCFSTTTSRLFAHNMKLFSKIANYNDTLYQQSDLSNPVKIIGEKIISYGSILKNIRF